MTYSIFRMLFTIANYAIVYVMLLRPYVITCVDVYYSTCIMSRVDCICQIVCLLVNNLLV